MHALTQIPLVYSEYKNALQWRHNTTAFPMRLDVEVRSKDRRRSGDQDNLVILAFAIHHMSLHTFNFRRSPVNAFSYYG